MNGQRGADGAADASPGAEFRELLASVLAAAGPLLAQAVPGPEAPTASCTWCPVCALVALSRGEQHPLLTAVGSQGVAVLTMLRDLLADSVDAHAAAGGDAGGHGSSVSDGHRDGGSAPGAGAPEPASRRTAPGGPAGPGSTGPSSPRFQRIGVRIAGDDADRRSGPGRDGP